MNVKKQGDILSVTLSGELDEHAARGLRDEMDGIIARAQCRALVMDFSSVTFVDSTGLGFIMGRYRKLKARGIELAVKGAHGQVDKVFKTSGVYTFAPKI